MKKVITILELLESAKKEISNIKKYQEFLTFCKKFYEEDFKNQLLIFKQDRNATTVKSFVEWKYYGRKLKRHPKVIYLCRPYKVKEKKVIDGQLDIDGKEKKERKNNMIENIGTEKIEKICKFDISDTVDKRMIVGKIKLIPTKIVCKSERIYDFLKELYPEYSNNIENIDDDIIDRLYKFCNNYLKEKNVMINSEFYSIFVDCVVFLVADYHNIRTNNMILFEDFDKLLNINLSDFLNFGTKTQKVASDIINFLISKNFFVMI